LAKDLILFLVEMEEVAPAKEAKHELKGYLPPSKISTTYPKIRDTEMGQPDVRAFLQQVRGDNNKSFQRQCMESVRLLQEVAFPISL